MSKIKRALEELTEKASASICACYWYDFQNVLPDLTLADLNEIAKNPYYAHIINGDDLHECPEYMQELAENEMDRLREEGLLDV